MLEEGTGSVLGEYRLLIEVTLDEDGRKLLTAVVQPFNGMLSRGPGSGCRIPAGQSTAAFSFAAPPHTTVVLTAAQGLSTGLSARLCVQWQDKVVCLGVAPGEHSSYERYVTGIHFCELIFQWHMPAIALPDVVADTANSTDWRLSNISPQLFVKFKACSAARDTWIADSFELQVQPNLQLDASINDDPEAEPDTDFYYDSFNGSFDQDCQSDMMALCFLHEVMAMPRRSVERYARSGEEEEDEEEV